MNEAQKKDLAKHVYDIAHLTGEFKLRSGVISNEYFDKYQFESNPELLVSIAIQLNHVVNSLEYDYLAALEMGGIPIATAMAMMNKKSMVFVRKEAKEYGTAKLAEGPEIENTNLLIVEDVVTSGGQIIISANDLRERGATITDAVCVIDREAGGREKLAEAGIKLHSLFTMSELKDAVK
jgi:orotate phosphoribosyltransferase